MSFERDLCVVGGCGRVGLPLGLAFAQSGLKVTIYDINAEAVKQVQKREMPFYESGAQELLASLPEENFLVTTDIQEVSKVEFVVVIIGTPVDAHLNPKFDDFAQVVAQLSEHLRDGQLLVLRNTVYPGTTVRTANLLQAWFKTSLSRLAGVSLHYLTGLPTQDVTNSFKLYSLAVIDSITIESTGGFEIGMEIVVKAWAGGFSVTEVPTVWKDRALGDSRFKLLAWLPRYLHWYFYCIRHAWFGSTRCVRS